MKTVRGAASPTPFHFDVYTNKYSTVHPCTLKYDDDDDDDAKADFII